MKPITLYWLKYKVRKFFGIRSKFQRMSIKQKIALMDEINKELGIPSLKDRHKIWKATQ